MRRTTTALRLGIPASRSPGHGWNIAAIEPDRVQTRYNDDGAPAWFATIKRI
jgi:hypothetical protein